MKTKKTELNVDFIGGEGSLTAEEEKALSDYFRRKKHNTRCLNDNSKTQQSKRA
jgi:hypothetical protein